MDQLYPLKFTPILKDKLWGGSRLKNVFQKSGASDKCGESWEISGFQDDVSVVSNGYLEGNSLDELIEVYMGDLVGDKVFERFGTQFPLLAKFIDANDKLSIQVHPDDDMAFDEHGSFGKTEMWYIIDSEPGANIVIGFNQEVTPEVVAEHLNDNSLDSILNVENVYKGDVFFLPAGRIHSISEGILLAEIQQCSDITYRLYDWNRKDVDGKTRELHTDLALKAIDYKSYPTYKTNYEKVVNKTVLLQECKYFCTNFLHFDIPVGKDYNYIDSFIIYMCLEGEVEIDIESGNHETIKKGETVLIPAELKSLTLIPKVSSKILEVYINNLD